MTSFDSSDSGTTVALTQRQHARQRLQWLNDLSAQEALVEFLACCGSRAWAHGMAAARPYSDPAALIDTAAAVWSALDPPEWLVAFGSHPRIGERPVESAPASSALEQAGVSGAEPWVIEQLAQGNRTYEEKFGHVFLICATGRSAEEMLAALRLRLGNSAEAELRIAADEQRKITRLRLERLLQEDSST